MLVLTGSDSGVPVLIIVISFPPHRLDDHHWWSGSYANAGQSDLSCKKLSSIGQRNMIAIGTALRQVGLRPENAWKSWMKCAWSKYPQESARSAQEIRCPFSIRHNTS